MTRVMSPSGDDHLRSEARQARCCCALEVVEAQVRHLQHMVACRSKDHQTRSGNLEVHRFGGGVFVDAGIQDQVLAQDTLSSDNTVRQNPGNPAALDEPAVSRAPIVSVGDRCDYAVLFAVQADHFLLHRTAPVPLASDCLVAVAAGSPVVDFADHHCTGHTDRATDSKAAVMADGREVANRCHSTVLMPRPGLHIDGDCRDMSGVALREA